MPQSNRVKQAESCLLLSFRLSKTLSHLLSVQACPRGCKSCIHSASLKESHGPFSLGVATGLLDQGPFPIGQPSFPEGSCESQRNVFLGSPPHAHQLRGEFRMSFQLNYWMVSLILGPKVLLSYNAMPRKTASLKGQCFHIRTSQNYEAGKTALWCLPCPSTFFP